MELDCKTKLGKLLVLLILCNGINLTLLIFLALFIYLTHHVYILIVIAMAII